MRMRHINIPIFIPHLGCPNQCVFCNQRTISGVQDFREESVAELIEQALSTTSKSDEVEIAFFGGSFTGIDRNLMIRLLDIANRYIIAGRVKSIRCSTRPDYIDENVLSILWNYGVRSIELGLQSIENNVLIATKRGHDFECAKSACNLIVNRGFNLTGQMMIGLPGSTVESEISTAKFIINSGCSSARIYPTVVFKDTELCSMTENALYSPLSLEDAVDRSATVLKMFIDAGVKVIRVGLCASDNLLSEDTYYAGPNHPALGELVESEVYYRLICEKYSLIQFTSNDILTIGVARGNISKAVGQRKRNKLRLIQTLNLNDAKFEEIDYLNDYDVLLTVKNGDNKCI